MSQNLENISETDENFNNEGNFTEENIPGKNENKNFSRRDTFENNNPETVEIRKNDDQNRINNLKKTTIFRANFLAERKMSQKLKQFDEDQRVYVHTKEDLITSLKEEIIENKKP